MYDFFFCRKNIQFCGSLQIKCLWPRDVMRNKRRFQCQPSQLTFIDPKAVFLFYEVSYCAGLYVYLEGLQVHMFAHVFNLLWWNTYIMVG